MANPNSLILDRYQDIHNTDKTLFNQFITLYNNGDFDGAKAVLDEICLSCKGKTSNIFNQIINALNKMESLYTDNVQEYLANLLSSLEEIKYIGVYDSGLQYNRNNIVAYNDEMYLCLIDTTAGTLPTVETSWLYLGLKGEAGSGYIIGMSYLGDWETYDPSQVFNVNNLVLEDGIIYYCILQNTNKRPSENPTYWTVFMYEDRQEIEGTDKLPEIYGVKGVGFENSELERTHNSVGLTYEKFPNPDVVTEGVSNSMITPLENTVGGNYIQATNIIENGDFSNGSTRWSASASHLSVSSNTLSVTGNGMTRGAYAYQTTLTPFTAGKKIRFKYMAMVDNDDCVQLEVYIKGSTTGDLTQVKTVSNPDALIWQDIDFITTLPAGHTGNLMVYIGHMYSSPFIADTKVMEVQEFYAVDLTADFGAGSEPDLTECKRIFPAYFEGRQMFDLDKGGVFQSFVEKQYFANQLITNGDFSDGTTGWSTNNLTQSVSNGINTILATSQYGLLYHDLEIDFISGHKYYYCARIQTATATTSIKVGLMDSVNMIGINCASTTEWQTVSQLVTWETGRTLSEFYIQDVRASGWNNIKVDYTMVIDLTATFGIGYEPIFSECQTLFSSYFPEGREIWYTNGGGFQALTVKGLTATQLVANGNFASGTTRWIGGGGSTISIVSGNLRGTSDGTSISPMLYNSPTIRCPASANDKIYIRLKVRVNNDKATEMILYILEYYNGSYVRTPVTVTIAYNPIQDQWYDIDNIYTLTSNIDFNHVIFRIYAIYPDLSTSNGKTHEIKGGADGVILVNLTDTFGAGLEPDLATCQTLFPSYFDGTISVDKGEVSVIGKNLINLGSKNIYDVTGAITRESETAKAIIRNYDIIYGLSTDASFNSSVTMNIVGNTLSYTTSGSGYGVGLKFKIQPSTIYKRSYGSITGSASVGFYDINGSYIMATGNTTFTTPSNSFYAILCFYGTSAGTFTVTNPQLELGSTATTYAPYNVTRARYPKLQSVPDIQDTFNVLTGLHTQNITTESVSSGVTLSPNHYPLALVGSAFRISLTGGGEQTGTIKPNIWTSVAPKLGTETRIYSLAVFNNKLYGGTGQNGKLYEWNGTDAWIEVAPKLGSETYIWALAVFNNKLYGGTFPNGKLYEWNGTNAWVEVAPMFGSETDIRSLAVFNDKLYGGTYPNGKLLEWNGTNAWVEVAPKLGSETYIPSLAVFNNKLYGGTFPNGKLYEWNGTDTWIEVAPKLGSETYIWALAVFNNKLYGGTGENGKLYEWNGTNAWVEVAPKLSAETDISSLAVFNNKLYGGTNPNGKLLEWNGTNAWIEVAPKLGDETDIHSLAVFNNKLYGGTGQNGKLYEYNQDTSSGVGILYYGLTTPILTQYPAINIPLLEKSTIQYAPYIYDTGTYSTSFSITDTDYPISTLVEVTRNGVPIDISTCTIAGGGLSFTSTVLASGDEISVRYNHGLPTATPTTEYILNTPSLTTSRIYSDFDNHFPYNEITEVTDSAGNVFVRIPKFYTYRDANSIAISKYKISDLWELNPVFMFGGEERDYVYIGKYEASGSTGRIYSKPSQNVLVNITRTQGRTASLANGSTYFQSDIWVNQLLRDLFTVEFATTNSQSIMYGYAKDNTVAISTGNTNTVPTPTGSPTNNESGNYASKYRGVENVWGNVYKFIDGVTSYGNAIYVAYDPSLYIDGNNTNHNLVGYNTIPQVSAGKYTDINGFDKYNPFAVIPISVGDDSQAGYSDQFYKDNNSSNYLIWREGGYWDSEYGAGIWLLRGSTITNDIYTGTRLCAYDIT